MQVDPQSTIAISKVVNFKSNSKKPSIEQLVSLVTRKKREQGRYRANRKKASS